MAITAAQVKSLREKTGAGMMDCKKALTDSDGDIDLVIATDDPTGAKVLINPGSSPTWSKQVPHARNPCDHPPTAPKACPPACLGLPSGPKRSAAAALGLYRGRGSALDRAEHR